MYEVIKLFTDLKDGGHRYNVGDRYPREGLKVSDARLQELSGNTNKQGVPLIREIAHHVENAPTIVNSEAVVEVEQKSKRGGRKAKSDR